ncbi:MAG: hypothetical protein AMJ61_05000 [Desulfobacterales bacterium SG8_35_2]|nr:MAG: hypothetical protein AMJ61_05000 [Desulfobacterales bacterium SG8_35_2]
MIPCPPCFRLILPASKTLLVHKVAFHGNRSKAKNKKEKSGKRIFQEGDMRCFLRLEHAIAQNSLFAISNAPSLSLSLQISLPP